jgi:hypothetical protein
LGIWLDYVVKVAYVLHIHIRIKAIITSPSQVPLTEPVHLYQ